MSIKDSSFDVPGMDCPSEEQMVRFALGSLPSVRGLRFDLERRRLNVLHDGPVDPIIQHLTPLGFGAKLVETVESTEPDNSDAEAGQGRVLMQLLVINATMFLAELGFGLWAQSTGLLSDSLDMLADAMRTANAAEWAQRKTTTQSGCRCSGYSNDHGFGSYCYGWEFEAQVPWCYVTEECKSEQVVGSFGRKFEDCPLYDEPGYDDPGYDGNFTDWSEPYYNESEWAASWEREREYEQEYARQFDEGEEGDEGEPWWQEAAEWDPDEESTDFGSKLQRDLWKSNWRADSCECNAYWNS